MEREYVREVAQIERVCFTSHWPESAFMNELTNRSARYVVAVRGGRVIGFAGMWVIMDEAHVTTIGVLPEHRRRKIGERLLVRLIEIARSLGARRATLEVRKSNTAALRLYEKYAFTGAAIRRGYYTDTGEDAIVMWVNDLWSPEFEAAFYARRSALPSESE
ncbi:MAG: ribosomal protein S18-alanine N-acetyltransferase [Armatimonadetes bacterium]|nr:ribosomal protein S18-alanine N-acetyltransferase [Armatimonadota bacterium]